MWRVLLNDCDNSGMWQLALWIGFKIQLFGSAGLWICRAVVWMPPFTPDSPGGVFFLLPTVFYLRQLSPCQTLPPYLIHCPKERTRTGIEGIIMFFLHVRPHFDSFTTHDTDIGQLWKLNKVSVLKRDGNPVQWQFCIKNEKQDNNEVVIVITEQNNSTAWLLCQFCFRLPQLTQISPDSNTLCPWAVGFLEWNQVYFNPRKKNMGLFWWSWALIWDANVQSTNMFFFNINGQLRTITMNLWIWAPNIFPKILCDSYILKYIYFVIYDHREYHLTVNTRPLGGAQEWKTWCNLFWLIFPKSISINCQTLLSFLFVQAGPTSGQWWPWWWPLVWMSCLLPSLHASVTLGYIMVIGAKPALTPWHTAVT